MESKRISEEKNLQTVNSIFISADKGLQKWDLERAESVPVVVATNIWLLLLARLISRSEDDFKCFINMVNREQIISNKEFFEVVKVINNIVEDVKQQESVIDVMVEEEFAFLNNGGEKRTSEFIAQKTEEEAQRIITQQIQQLEKVLEKTNRRLDDSEKTIKAQQIALMENEQIIEKELLNEEY